MNFPQNSAILQFLYWLVNTPGVGGGAVIALIVVAVAACAAALRWVMRGGQADEPVSYSYPTSALHHHQ